MVFLRNISFKRLHTCMVFQSLFIKCIWDLKTFLEDAQQDFLVLIIFSGLLLSRLFMNSDTHEKKKLEPLEVSYKARWCDVIKRLTWADRCLWLCRHALDWVLMYNRRSPQMKISLQTRFEKYNAPLKFRSPNVSG